MIGILAAQIVNWLIAVRLPFPGAADVEAARAAWNVASGWRWMFTAVTVPSLLFFAGALFVPESPRWLLGVGRARAGAPRAGPDRRRGLRRRRVGRDRAHARAREPSADLGACRALLEPRVKAIVLVGVALAVLQQWSGINSIFNYAEEIYRSAGYGIGDIMFNIVITGTINLVFTLVAIAMVDRVGRRTLMLVGCAGHRRLARAARRRLRAPAAGPAGPRVHALLARRLRAVAGAGHLGADRRDLPEPRPRRRRLGGRVGALDGLLHPDVRVPAAAAHGPASRGTFWIYAAICFAGFVFVRAKVPETKGRSLEQIEGELMGPAS